MSDCTHRSSEPILNGHPPADTAEHEAVSALRDLLALFYDKEFRWPAEQSAIFRARQVLARYGG